MTTGPMTSSLPVSSSRRARAGLAGRTGRAARGRRRVRELPGDARGRLAQARRLGAKAFARIVAAYKAQKDETLRGLL
jgi:hypothetical protein